MEEVGSCSHLMLKLGAGCTAPPPTPARRPADVDPTISSASLHYDQNEVDTLWMSAPASAPTPIIFVNDDGEECSDSGMMCGNSTPPSRADLDELARYLTQQSLLATPTLLASPSFRRKREIVSGSCMGGNVATAEEATTDQSSHDKEEEFQGQIRMVGGEQTATYSYAMEGFYEESKAAIRRTCEEEGVFYVQVTDMGKATLDGIYHVLEQCLNKSRMCLIGSGPIISFSELMTPTNDASTTVASCEQEESGYKLSLTEDAQMDANFRDKVIELANLFLEISKKLINILLEDVSLETRIKLSRQSLKPLLYCHRTDDQEFHVLKRGEDVVFSIISPGKLDYGPNVDRVSLLAVLGNSFQSWSQGKLKPPTMPSLCNLVDKQVCLQLDLKYQL